MLRKATALLLFLAAACGESPANIAPPGTVTGHLSPDVLGGDAYLFLYDPGEGPPALPGPPRHLTAVTQTRITAGDRRFVFAQIPDGAYRLSGFVDVDQNFGTEVDLLAQPSAGDLPLLATELLAEGVTELALPVAAGVPFAHHPPAFAVGEGAATALIPDLPLTPVSLTLNAETVGPFDAERGGFAISLADADGDGVSEDRDGDGLPDLFPRVFLRFLPRPGQTTPLNTDGTAAEVVVPLLFLPQDFLPLLGGDPSVVVRTQSLTVFVIPLATAIFRGSGGRRFTTTLEAVPVGDYELVVIAESGQVWRVPNELSTEAAARVGGPYRSQRTTFTVFHGSTRLERTDD